MDRRHVEHLSKMLSLMLRHRPEEFGVEVDRYGYADLKAVLAALQERTPSVTMEDVEHLVYHAEKQRFEIAEGKIRARYGHSIPIEMDREPMAPPEFLYQEVSAGDLEVVKREGLRPLDRQYVHLSFDPHRETRQGRRRGAQVVVRVRAREAHAAGVAFFDCGPTILTAGVPAAFIDVPDLPPEPVPQVSQVLQPPPLPSQTTSGTATEAPRPPAAYGRRRKTVPRR